MADISFEAMQNEEYYLSEEGKEKGSGLQSRQYCLEWLQLRTAIVEKGCSLELCWGIQ